MCYNRKYLTWWNGPIQVDSRFGSRAYDYALVALLHLLNYREADKGHPYSHRQMNFLNRFHFLNIQLYRLAIAFQHSNKCINYSCVR